jgi:hypothetical protein
MALGDMVLGLRVAVDCALNTVEDRAMGAGTLN